MKAPELPKSLLVVAGAGSYPELVVEGARKAGVGLVGVLGFKGGTTRRLRCSADRFAAIPFGSLSRFLDEAAAFRCDAVVLAGLISPLQLFRARFDDLARKELRALPVKNAHTMFGRISELLAAHGMAVYPASCFMAGHIPAAAGVLTKTRPGVAAEADLDFGFRAAMAVCNLDIGQSVVVKAGVVLAVEGFDGTNATIRRGGRIGRGGSALVKVAKENHDERFDIPVIGLKTLKLMRRYGLTALGIQAGRSLVLDLPAVVALADKLGIAIEVRESGLPHFDVFR